MELQTKIPLKPVDNQFDHQSQLLVLGSCFAENIADKLKYFKFQALQNPFGILFHPLAIEKLILKAANKEKYSEEDIFFLNERWHCFDAHSDLSSTSKEDLLEKLNNVLDKTNRQITESTHVVITLGTAWVYRNSKTKQVVANCHKVPQKEFSKELLSVSGVEESLKNIIQTIGVINPKAQFILTVSPVRHLKDGFVENQRSKAHLITAIHELIDTPNFLPVVSYFPSYEIMMDELRDYRFYKADMVHPNEIAVDYIWEKFCQVWLSQDAHSMMEKVDVVQKGLHHRPSNPESEQYQVFKTSLERKIAYLQEAYPHMKFSK